MAHFTKWKHQCPHNSQQSHWSGLSRFPHLPGTSSIILPLAHLISACWFSAVPQKHAEHAPALELLPWLLPHPRAHFTQRWLISLSSFKSLLKGLLNEDYPDHCIWNRNPNQQKWARTNNWWKRKMFNPIPNKRTAN